ncbi:Flp pilus assembly protein CpaB [Desulfitobacterium hafniense]|uniref:Flp pilus assembly protein CpaB n=1 Tax=Desulfitobacterium hafniense TaxID=49338 RepID=UPI000363EADB|nr:Flp pilus assembly protein CpaB [Desulfitobacterium hafniense]
MGFLKNRTVLGGLCIVLSLFICFALTPLFNQSVARKATVVRVAKDIKSGDAITKEMVQTVEVGGYNLPENVIRQSETVIGKYATADLLPGDYILAEKIADIPAFENAYLYSLNGDKRAISVSLKSLAQGLSGKLISGDIVSVIAPDYRKQGSTVIPPELTYVEVIGVTASTGYDTDDSKRTEDNGDERELPATVTLLVSPEQAKILADLEADGKLHLTLVYRGYQEGAARFTQLQDKVIATLYPAPTEYSTGTSTQPPANSDTPAEPENPAEGTRDE